ncbi:nuclear transport factor 2 family protein [Actinobacteria bacterium YIM 96077]|uniref:Nuclear transport factor 2 family protein n=1 Tax=Phytoactinopolyspora halophila TaxID=1981511 RepID=A0A329R308_9ACTN|nr:nuclear transport factor 2 family protein [Actinobacteria bacterium YIM 96077]RAW18967.1 nuclear transport factor 2 family protein [Phytoactinopolyspora halophila]
MRDLYHRWLADLWNGDLDRLEDIATGLVSPAFVGHWPGRPALVQGPDSLAQVVRAGRLPFDPLTFDVEVGPLVDGDTVAARWVARGAYAGGEHALPGATAEPGTPIEFRGHDLLRVAGDRFVEYWVISEAEHLMAQLSGTA